jgi:hypothetical protein
MVSCVSGVDARTQTSPVDNFIAVERPPTGMPNLVNGLPNAVRINALPGIPDALRKCRDFGGNLLIWVGSVSQNNELSKKKLIPCGLPARGCLGLSLIGYGEESALIGRVRVE